ncbi:MAG: leucine-rich repeat domain-containing protein, partial [Christensenellaceae bacterium]|nr:leucine-rich repeat domain-containing protein [Christensenellaceae bacterium]
KYEDHIAAKSRFSRVDGFLIKDNKYLVDYYGELDDITVPSGIETIGRASFMYDFQIEKLKLPSSVTLIDKYAFFFTQALNSIELPEGLLELGDYSFYYVDALYSLTIPTTLTTLGEGALYRSTNLIIFKTTTPLTITDNTLYDKVIILVPDEYLETYKSASVWSDHAQYIYPISISDETDYLVDTDGTLIKYLGNESEIVMPSTVTAIGTEAFAKNKTITKITIHKEVVSIGEDAFANCTNLNTVIIAEGSKMTSIGDYAFQYTESLISFVIPLGVTEIQPCVFYNSGLKEIFIHENITNIGEFAFAYNDNLESLTFAENINLETIGSNAFAGSSKLSSITIPASVKEMPYAFNNSGLIDVTFAEGTTIETINAFSNCKKLTSITLPNSVTTIPYQAFGNCEALTTISIGSNIASISYFSFYGCTSLTEIYIDLESLEDVNLDSNWNFIGFDSDKKEIYAAYRLKGQQG